MQIQECGSKGKSEFLCSTSSFPVAEVKNVNDGMKKNSSRLFYLEWKIIRIGYRGKRGKEQGSEREERGG